MSHNKLLLILKNKKKNFTKIKLLFQSFASNQGVSGGLALIILIIKIPDF